MTAQARAETTEAFSSDNRKEEALSRDYDGFAKRMTERLEKVRRLLHGEAETSTRRSDREIFRA